MGGYRDDRDALLARLAALERQAARAARLEERIRELERENEALRSATAAPVLEVEVPVEAADVYVDAKVVAYVAAIVAASRAPDPRLASGAGPGDDQRIVAATQARAAAAGRRYVTPTDVAAAVRALLPGRLLLRDGVDDATAAAVVDELLARVPVP